MSLEYRRYVLERSDPRLGRNVNHDPFSWGYPATMGPAREPVSVDHQRLIEIFDQANLGSCTGEAAIGCCGYEPFFSALPARPRYPLNQTGAVACYSRATEIDPYGGAYPPQDTGSDGLSVAKAVVEAGMINGYLHAFGLTDALLALPKGPQITGTVWRTGMFEPTREGFVKPTGSIAGGHEYILAYYDAVRGVVGFDNSWGAGWGLRGRFFMAAEDYGSLLADDGDVTQFVPLSAPQPEPQDPRDVKFAKTAAPWSRTWHSGITAPAMRKATREWLTSHGY